MGKSKFPSGKPSRTKLKSANNLAQVSISVLRCVAVLLGSRHLPKRRLVCPRAHLCGYTVSLRMPRRPLGACIVQPPTNPANLEDPALYLNRDLSWLDFNRRVLEEAQDSSVPMLERLKFLAIFSSNLDEFYMVRVGNIQQKVQANIPVGSGADQMSPRLQLEQVRKPRANWYASNIACCAKKCWPALAAAALCSAPSIN